VVLFLGPMVGFSLVDLVLRPAINTLATVLLGGL
jgi:hypothetical protein